MGVRARRELGAVLLARRRGGFTSGLVNVTPHRPLQLLDRLRAGDHAAAMAVWRASNRSRTCARRPATPANVSVVKEALAQLGLCGRAVRPPISEVSTAERAEVATILADLVDAPVPAPV